MQPRGPSKREAHKSDQQGRGHRSIPETSGRVYVYGKPVDAGRGQCGPHERIHENRTTQEANCKHNREAQREGEPQQ